MAHAVKQPQGGSTSNFQGGSYKTTLDYAGRLLPVYDENGLKVGEDYQIEKTDYGFELDLKFNSEKFHSVIKLPKFVANTEDKVWNNFNQYNKNGVNPVIVDGCIDEEIEKKIIKNFVDQHIAWGTDFIGVFVDNPRGYCMTQAKKALLMSPKFELVGNLTDGVWEGLTEQPLSEVKDNYTVYYLGEKPNKQYFSSFTEDGVIYIYQKLDTSELNLEEHLSFIEATTNQVVETFWNSLIMGANEYNQDKKPGYIFKSFVDNKEGTNSFLKPVTTVKSLMVSYGKVKVENEYYGVTRDTVDQFDTFKSFWYGFVLGLTSMELAFKDDDGVWVNRLQFPFRKDAFRSDIEGTDVLVTYRDKYKNPFLKLVKEGGKTEESAPKTDELTSM